MRAESQGEQRANEGRGPVRADGWLYKRVGKR